MTRKKDCPLVSILIGTRDRPQPLLRCLNSILSQNYPELEVLVLDDCSEGHSICDILTKQITDHRVECFRSEQQLGVAGGRSSLLQRAQGEIIFVIDDDAVWDNNECLSRAVSHFPRDPKIGALAFKVINHRGAHQELLIPFSRRSRKKWAALEDETRLTSYYLGAAHALRREAIERCGPYQEDLIFGGEELDLAYRLIQNGFVLLYVPEIVAHHFPERSTLEGGQKKHRRGELYYSIRNRIWFAYRYLPFPYLFVYPLVWLGYYGVTALKGQQLGEFLRGAWAGVIGLKQLHRGPLNERAMAYLKENFGRLWY